MPRVIFKCPYKKPGAGRAGYVTYIATRDGVEKITHPDAPATKKQQDYIKQLEQDFSQVKQSDAYQTFEQNPTMGNASALISESVNQYAEEMVGADGYVNYITTRPRAEKNGASHGLFAVNGDLGSQATPTDLEAVAEEIEHHPGNLWMPIISLKREDAVAVGMDSAKGWQKFLSNEKNQLAKQFGIKPEHFKAYAAFHDEGHHPHIHMVCYSTNPQEGFLSKKGIHNIKSHLTTKIFAEQLRPLYEKKTAGRTAAKQEAQEALGQILGQMESAHLQNAKIEQLMVVLSEKLSVTAGKKQYGYLKPELKNLVDEIVSELAKEERVATAYELWWDCKEKIDQGYHEREAKRIPLMECNDFRSLRNMVIKEAVDLSDRLPLLDEFVPPEQPIVTEQDGAYFQSILESEIPPQDFQPQDFLSQDFPPQKLPSRPQSGRPNWWTEEYKLARQYLYGDETAGIPQDFEIAYDFLWAEAFPDAGKDGNPLAMCDLAKLTQKGLGCTANPIQAQGWYAKAVELLRPPAEAGDATASYFLGKLVSRGLGTIQDDHRAIKLFVIAAERGNQHAQVSLGTLYLSSQTVRNPSQAKHWLTLSAEQGNEKAKSLLEHLNASQTPSTLLMGSRLLHHISRIFRRSMPPSQTAKQAVDKKLRRQTKEKKIALGHHQDDHEQEFTGHQ